MPTITATVHQVLRYFFVGALFTAFAAVPPGEHWSLRFTCFLTEKVQPGAPVVGIAMLIAGSLIYAAHRVVLYPLIFRVSILSLPELGTPEQSWRHWCPYGKAVSRERHLEQLGASIPEREGPHFMGWATECHLCYLATEIALFTLFVWAGWRVSCQWAWGLGLGLGVFGLLVAAWDRQAISLLVDRARNPVP